MEEGSVINDETYLPSSVEESEESEDSVDSPVEETPEAEEPDSPEVAYTEKGTRLDPNPASAAYQELANERAKVRQYQEVLNNPQTLRAYAQQMGLSVAEVKAEVKEAQKFSAEKLQTADDVVAALNSVTSEIDSIRQENEQLRAQMTGFASTSRIQQITNVLQSDIGTVRDKYPELNPKNPSYDAGLEKELAELYKELDYDDQSGGYMGRVSIASLADRLMRAVGTAKKRGSEEAQTTVKQKQAGRVVTSSKSNKKEVSESSDPGTAIAQRIARAMGN